MREFMEAVDEFRNKDVLLVDTPGYGHAELEGAREMAAVWPHMNSKRDPSGAAGFDEARRI